MDHRLRELERVRLIDLSVSLCSSVAEPDPPKIEYIGHRRAAEELAAIATHLVRNSPIVSADAPQIAPDSFQDGLGLANENLHLDTHAGTHMDAPWHFGPVCERRAAKTIDEVPLSWCFGPGVVLDLRHKKAGEEIHTVDLQAALAQIDYALCAGDIVLIMTGADKHYDQPDYFSAHPGMGREATLWLIEQGIKVIGIDAWGFDRPAGAMLGDYLKSQDSHDLLPAHMVGREREYCHIEKLGQLDQIPIAHGFWISCFPIKVLHGSAGWVRVVAMVPFVDPS